MIKYYVNLTIGEDGMWTVFRVGTGLRPETTVVVRYTCDVAAHAACAVLNALSENEG